MKKKGGEVVAKEPEKEEAEEEKPKGEDAKGEGPLKGKLVRVVDEKSVYCGRVVEVMGHAKGTLNGHVAWKAATENFLEKTKVPAKVCIPETSVVCLESIQKPELTPWKSLRFKDEERAEAETLFLPEELETGYKLSKQGSLPLIHMEMWLWLMVRDFELKKIERIKLLSPQKMAYICTQMQLPDAAERFVEHVGTLGAELQGKKLILLPIWGNNPEHWTLLILLKGDEGAWTVQYKDSLSGLHKECQGNAQKLVTLMSCALMTDLEFPEGRCNQKMQPKGSLECGFFVCHWVEQSIREELGEGAFAIGLPNVGRVFERLASCSASIIRNKGWAALHEAKAAKAKEALDKKAAEEAKQLAEKVKSKEFQEQVQKDARMKTLIPWATLSGCAKCRYAVTGSTCCNPEKMRARDLALEESTDGKLDKALYEKKLVQVYAEIMAQHESPVLLSKLPKKGGGGQKDTRHSGIS